MSPRKLLVLTAVVVVLFFFILLFERKMPTTSERQEKGDLVWELPENQIEGIELSHGGSVVELKKTGGAWRIVRPETYPADTGAVSDVLAQLARLKKSGGDSSEARPEDYGLKSPSAKAVLTLRGEKEEKKKTTRTVVFGLDIPGTDSAAARVDGSDAVLFVTSGAAKAARKSVDDFKSRDVFGAGLEITRLDVDRGRGRLSLARRNGVWWLVQPLEDLADPDAVQRLTGQLTGLRITDFVPAGERQNLAALGLNPPLYRVVAADAKGITTTVDFGATKSDGNSVYARREGQVFTVSSATVEDLSKEAEAFRDPRLVEFDRAAATAIDASFSPQTFALVRKDSGWTLGGRPVGAAAADDTITAILDLKSRSFVDGTAAAGLKSTSASGTLTVKLSAGDPWTVTFYPRRGDMQATVSGRPGAFLLPGDAVAKVETALRKVAAAPTPAPPASPTKKP